MAGSRYYAASSSFPSPPLLLLRSGARRIYLKSVLCSSSVLPPFPSKSYKRKNYLRPKILKTLKPKPSWEEPSIHTVVRIETTESVPPYDEVLEPPSDQIELVEEFQVSDSSVVAKEQSGIVCKFSPKGFVRYGLYLLGIFAFQTICAVWIMGNGNSDKKDGNPNSNNSNMSVSDENLNTKKILLNGDKKYFSGKNGFNQNDVIYLDELEMNEKIEEIREMAREARKIEQKGHKNKREEDEILDSSNDRTNIEKEIEVRLANMEKRLNSQRKGLAGLHMRHLDEFGGDEEDEMSDIDVEENDIKNLMFKKKYKFKSEKPPSNVKGFSGRNNNRVADKSENGDPRKGISGTLKTEKGKRETNGRLNSLLNNGKNSRKMHKEVETAKSQLNSGVVQETNSEDSSTKEIQKSRTLRDSGTHSLNFVEETKETVSESHEEHALAVQDGNLEHEEAGNRSSIRKARVSRSDTLEDVWWLKLSYVLRILMRSSIDQERSEGFFTLRTDSEAPNSEESSYTVAFEDPGDARNFCSLLESFFEDLDDFCADIVPVSTKDLLKEMKSADKRVIVVKKRQVQLYAGQPLEDLERTLHSLILEESNK